MWSPWSLGRYIEYLMHFIVSRAHLGQLISYLAKVGTFTVHWVIHDIMPRTGTELHALWGKLKNKNKQQRCMDRQ